MNAFHELEQYYQTEAMVKRQQLKTPIAKQSGNQLEQFLALRGRTITGMLNKLFFGYTAQSPLLSVMGQQVHVTAVLPDRMPTLYALVAKAAQALNVPTPAAFVFDFPRHTITTVPLAYEIFVLSWGKKASALFIDKSFFANVTDEALYALVLHEMAHIQKNDSVKRLALDYAWKVTVYAVLLAVYFSICAQYFVIPWSWQMLSGMVVAGLGVDFLNKIFPVWHAAVTKWFSYTGEERADAIALKVLGNGEQLANALQAFEARYKGVQQDLTDDYAILNNYVDAQNLTDVEKTQWKNSYAGTCQQRVAIFTSIMTQEVHTHPSTQKRITKAQAFRN
jgi:Zn-dependent protease with chaperone function